MSLNKFFAKKLRAVARSVENPQSMLLRLKKVDLNVWAQLSAPWIRSRRISTVIDIGANEGDFSFAACHALPDTRILAFEPLPDCFGRLQKRMSAYRNFTAFNIAVGERSGSVAFQRSAFEASSSCLKMAASHKRAFPHTERGDTVTVPMQTLDNAVADKKIDGPILIKIDVQGYEDRVLSGGEITVKRAEILMVETSFEVLYEGQALFFDIYQTLSQWGFRYAGAFEQLRDPLDGHVLQADSIFVRT